ncbi:phytanoyl-CoA dioxygenase family protein [Aliarcobacter cryaerophilus]|uniref:phytanoyl-CoA dioxygenase family protein n=1 Tax=Aliarcobacter cryaerophilus TaxID=28198 RepID=UPI0021B69F2E|nr:phytanoyl-CoA dioxygenase family protein [Aliarcobacter cryaerophilus]MCT7509564.1 phytanoyl-CoA dioxygenase family protein [Aliarcobacter cryaerophilus]
MLTEKQKEQYLNQGYVIVDNLLTASDLEPIREYAKTVLSEVATKLYNENLITQLYDNLDFDKRLIAISNEYKDAALMSTLQKKMGQSLFNLWRSEKLTSIAQQLLGDDINGHPFWALRSQIPTEKLLTVPWHQDAAYLMEGAKETIIFWIPLTTITKEGGCMEIIPAQNGRETRLYKHKVQNNQVGYENSWYVEIDEDLNTQNSIICEMPVGSILIFNESIIHRSLNNNSFSTRWSLDIRYIRANDFPGTHQSSIPIKRENGQFTDDEQKIINNYIENNLCDIPNINYPKELFTNKMWWLDKWKVEK